MAASGVSRSIVGQLLVNCMNKRACHAALQHKFPHCVGRSQVKRLLSTSKCLCEDKKAENSSEEAKSTIKQKANEHDATEQSVKKDTVIQELKGKSTSVDSKNQGDVISAGDESKQSSSMEDDSSSDSSSDSDSDSSSDSDNEMKSGVDKALEKAASDVAEVLPGDKAKTKTELLAKVLNKMKKKPNIHSIVSTPKAKEVQPKAKSMDSTPKAKGVRQGRTRRLEDIVNHDAKESPRRQGLVGSDHRQGDRQAAGARPARTGAESVQEARTVESVEVSVEPREKEVKAELSEEDEQLKQERRREVVEKMKKQTADVTRRLFDSERGDSRRQDRNDSMFESIDKRRRFSQDSGERREIQEDADGIDNKPVVSAFDGKPLGIFRGVAKTATKQPGRKYLYDILQEEADAAMYEYPPRNAWEEQIQWTKQGKLWTFPIDNEAGWDEKNVGFQEHVFLERQLRDFPQRGPIRHFMELVTVALSKNPYMTVQEKHEHIDWFRQYFKDKENVLTGPLGDMGLFKDSLSSTQDKSA